VALADGSSSSAEGSLSRSEGSSSSADGSSSSGERELSLAERILAAAVAGLGGEPRAGQEQMVAAVSAAISSGESLLVQAGTGTGKSLGYLAPAVTAAVMDGKRVIAATATLTLQRQLMNRDLPLVAEAARGNLPRTPTYALLKGRNNYLCRYKVAGGYLGADDADFTLFDEPSEADADEGKRSRKGANQRRKAKTRDATESFADQVRRCLAWAKDAETGDRDDLVPGVSDRAWRQVSVAALECFGSKCPMAGDCFSEAARQQARDADVVVTNHAMLGVAAGGSPGVLPEYDVLIVDEAHDLSSAVTSGATLELSLPGVERLARQGRRNGFPSTVLDAAAKSFGLALAAVPAGRFSGELPAAVLEPLVLIREEARKLVTLLKPEAGGEIDGQRKVAQSTALQVFEVATQMCDPGKGDVLWCTHPDADRPAFGTGSSGFSGNESHNGHSRLYLAPSHVANQIQELLGEATGIFTSATLMLGGKFDSVAKTLGFPPDDYLGIDVGSPFDYPKQGILYVARHLPVPGRESAIEGQLDEIEQLIRAAGGRTLGLFSSRRAAEIAAEAMRERLDTPILLQGEDQLPTLIKQFTDDAETSLFGSFALWQGVDVPGSACQLVIIDKLGFPRPDDPIMSARAEAIQNAGGNGFIAVSATHSALRLAQASGRLIRSSADRGVVAVLDPRLRTARYGEFLIRSIPPFWQTTDQSVALAALERLRDADGGGKS